MVWELHMKGALLMGFLGVAFLPYRACFYTTFLENCGRD